MKMFSFSISGIAKSLSHSGLLLEFALICALAFPSRVVWAQEELSGRPQLVLDSAPRSIFCVDWSPDGKLLASGTSFGAVRLWDAHTGALLRALEDVTKLSESTTVNTIAFSPDGRFLALGNNLFEIKIWDVQKGQVVHRLQQEKGRSNVLGMVFRAHQNQILSVAWSPDGKTLASGSMDRTAALWDVAAEMRLYTLQGHKDAVTGVAFSPDGKTLATVSEEMKLWDVQSGAPKGGLDLKGDIDAGADIGTVDWSPDGKTVALAMTPLLLWDVASQMVSNAGKISTAPFLGDNFVARFSPDSSVVATGHGPVAGEGSVLLWDAKTSQVKRTLRGYKKAVGDLAFSPDGKRLVSVGLEGELKIWSLQDERPPVTLVPFDGKRSDWLARTEEGFYDAPDSMWIEKEVKWRVGAQDLPFETYATTFRRPDIVRRLLQPEAIAANSEIGRLLATRSAPPMVAFIAPATKEKIKGETAALQVIVSDELAEQKLEFRVDGRPVAVTFSVGEPQAITDANRAQVLAGKPVPASHAIARRYSATIPLPPGESTILVRAIARDTSGLEGSADISLERELVTTRGVALSTLRGDEKREAEKQFQGDLHVISVGVSKYKNPDYNLSYAVADAEAFAKLWPPMKDRLYTDVFTTELVDDKATTPALQAALDKLTQTTTNKDTVMIFLAGHGVRVDDQDFYFGTHEIDFKNPAQTSLPWTSLTGVLAKVPAKRVVMFLDACHSGSALGEKRASNDLMAEPLIKRAGVMVFASSRGDQVSLESAQWKHGAFTKAVLEGIAEGEANLDGVGGKNGDITAVELLFYVQERVFDLTDGKQRPACPLMQDFGAPFNLARLPNE